MDWLLLQEPNSFGLILPQNTRYLDFVRREKTSTQNQVTTIKISEEL